MGISRLVVPIYSEVQGSVIKHANVKRDESMLMSKEINSRPYFPVKPVTHYQRLKMFDGLGKVIPVANTSASGHCIIKKSGSPSPEYGNMTHSVPFHTYPWMT